MTRPPADLPRDDAVFAAAMAAALLRDVADALEDGQPYRLDADRLRRAAATVDEGAARATGQPASGQSGPGPGRAPAPGCVDRG
ncbi:hypothetical protein [Streptomyces sp. NPDC004050]